MLLAIYRINDDNSNRYVVTESIRLLRTEYANFSACMMRIISQIFFSIHTITFYIFSVILCNSLVCGLF